VIQRFPRIVDAVAAALALGAVAVPWAWVCSAQAQSSRHGSEAASAPLGALAAVTGVVRDTTGAPQIGALVQLLGPNFETLAQTFTDDRGRYVLPEVRAGLYQLKASGSLYLPTLREHLVLAANSRMVVNLTLNTFYEALKWLPAEPRRPEDANDDWNWTLRLSANRPLLRVLDDGAGSGPVVLVSDGSGDAENARHERVTVRSGANRFGEGGMHQDIEFERTNDDARQLILRADVAQDPARIDSASIHTTAAWRQQLAPGRAVISVASFVESPQITSADQMGVAERGFGAFTLRSAETMEFGPDTHVEFGTELQAVRLASLVTGKHPFAEISHHIGDQTLSYRVATSPNAQQAASLDRDSTLAPSVTESAGVLHMEQGLHQELAWENHSGTWTTGVAYFHDRISHPVVSGGVAVDHGQLSVTDADVRSGDLIYDPATEMIAVSGEGYSASGLLAHVRDQLSPGSWIAVDYGAGEAMMLEPGSSNSTQFSALRPAEAQMIAAALGGQLGSRPGDQTQWRASYRWQSAGTLTQVSPFNGEVPDAFLSFYLRQPIRLRRGAPGRMQAIIDVRNLLAQGYRPFLSQDGSTLYFAQAERCVEGGFSFSF
jgi:hypothetical protein